MPSEASIIEFMLNTDWSKVRKCNVNGVVLKAKKNQAFFISETFGMLTIANVENGNPVGYPVYSVNLRGVWLFGGVKTKKSGTSDSENAEEIPLNGPKNVSPRGLMGYTQGGSIRWTKNC